MTEDRDPFKGLAVPCYTCNSDNTIIEPQGGERFVVACQEPGCGARWWDRLPKCTNCGRLVKNDELDCCINCAKRLCDYCIEEEACRCGA